MYSNSSVSVAVEEQIDAKGLIIHPAIVITVIGVCKKTFTLIMLGGAELYRQIISHAKIDNPVEVKGIVIAYTSANFAAQAHR